MAQMIIVCFSAQTIRIGLVILRSGGLPGGLNFDAKLRRESISVEDLVVAHVSGVSSFAFLLVLWSTPLS